jgi:microcystin-dependent protein
MPDGSQKASQFLSGAAPVATTTTVVATPGPGAPPSPWIQNGPTVSYDQGGAVVPSSVPGGTKGVGSINAEAIYINGQPLATSEVTVRLLQGVGIALTPNPILSDGTIALANTVVTPSSYGDAGHVAGFTVDQQGRLTAAGNIAITPSAIGAQPAGNYVVEAPSDGNTYGRSNAAWVLVGGGSGVGNTTEYSFNATTTSPPSSGQIRANTTDQTLATALYMSGTNAPGVNVYNYLMAELSAGGKLYLQTKDDSTKYVTYLIAGPPVGNTTWVNVPVTYQSGPGGVAAGQRCIIVNISSGGGASITISDTPPASPTAGALWWNSTLGQMFIWFTDPTSSQWVPASPSASAQTIPPGALMDFAGTTVPTGWLMCDGSQVSRTTNAPLFSAIGTTYGAGDGSTTFNLPDCRGRVTAGLDPGGTAGRLTAGGSGIAGQTLGAAGGIETETLTAAQMPSHNHTLGGNTVSFLASGGNLWSALANAPAAINAWYISQTDTAGSGAAHQNTQPTIIMNKIIKT